jgi:uncharacterized protein YcaQ
MHWSGNWEKNSQAARSVLEQLYTDGTLIIHHKNGSRKFYDLAERYLEESLLKADLPCEDEETLLCWRVRRRIGAVGLLWDRNSTAFLGMAMNAERRKAALSRLEASGEILPVRVEGIKPLFYYQREDASLMEAVLAGTVDRKPRMEFLAPLDPMLWDKAIVEALWNFRYSWEIYTPADKRKYGYYTLPVLWGENFIGRIETVADRKNGTLLVKRIWLEDGIRKTKKLQNTLESTIRRFARFNDCADIQYSDRIY